jgi:hypothetical protein
MWYQEVNAQMGLSIQRKFLFNFKKNIYKMLILENYPYFSPIELSIFDSRTINTFLILRA